MDLERKKKINRIDAEIRALTEQYYPTSPGVLKLPRKVVLSPSMPEEVSKKIKDLKEQKEKILKDIN